MPTWVSVYLCGWMVGGLCFRAAVLRPWRDLKTRASFMPLRGVVNEPRGLFAIFSTAFMLWWLITPLYLFSLWLDKSYEENEEEERDDQS